MFIIYLDVPRFCLFKNGACIYTVCTVLVFVYVGHSLEFASKISIQQL